MVNNSLKNIIVVLFSVAGFLTPFSPVQAERIMVIRRSNHSILFTNVVQNFPGAHVVRTLEIPHKKKTTYTGQKINFKRKSGLKNKISTVNRVKSPANCYAKGKNYNNIIKAVAGKYKVDPALVKAMVHAESSFNACARSKKGAMGLMQLMPGTAHYLNVRNPYGPKDNLKGGTRYMAHLMNRFNGDVKLSLAAYNAGPSNVKKHKGIPPFAETRAYVNKVLNLQRKYRRRANIQYNS